MRQTAKAPRENRTITVDFHDEATYFELLSDGKAFVEFVLAFILSLGFQLHRSCRSTVQQIRIGSTYDMISPKTT